MKAKLVLVLLFIYLYSSISFCLAPKACAQTAPQVSLFAKVGTGDYYTIYPTGLKKEDSYIGGFKSVQLDTQEENIYFYDTVLKVIARINILDGKIYKVVGKPKSTTILDYRTPVKFADASLGTLADFTFDKYGNIYILVCNNPSDQTNPRLLKASLKDGTVKEVLNFQDQFKPGISGNYSFSITLTNISYDQNKFIYAYGNSKFPEINNYGQWSGQYKNGSTIYRFDPLSSTSELFGGNSGLKELGFNPKYVFNPTNSTYLTLKSIAFDHSSTCYIGTSDYINSSWTSFIKKLVPSTNTDEIFTEEAFVGDGTGSTSDIGDGGQAKSAYAEISGAKCFCGDKNGDIYFADIATNRIRKILNDSGLITTAVGGGTETLTAYGQPKSPRAISLQSPNSILVDKYNNMYIADSTRILTVTSLVTHADKPSELVKIANLAITKIAGNAVNNPQGDIALPDLKLDYTFSGDQNIEVKGDNIPDGTNVKLLSVNTDGTTTPATGGGKLASGIATIPVKIEAGTTKVIQAETDPFIPAPGVYLPGTAPQSTTGQLPVETPIITTNKDEVNLITKDASGVIIKQNLIPTAGRFGFSNLFGWKHAYFYDYSNIQIQSNAAVDPDNTINGVTLLTFGPTNDAIYLPNLAPWAGTSTFTVWMKTDSGNITVPIGIGPYCNMPDWTGCASAGSFAGGNPTNYTYTNITVTPVWQKFTITSDANQDSQNKTLIIGGFGQTNNKKIYVWGARLEKSQ